MVGNEIRKVFWANNFLYGLTVSSGQIYGLEFGILSITLRDDIFTLESKNTFLQCRYYFVYTF